MVSRSLLTLCLMTALFGCTTETESGASYSDEVSAAYAAIPGVALKSDPATACPEAFRDSAPTAGQNDDFLSAEQSRNFFLALPDDLSAPRPILVGFNGTNGTGKRFFDRSQLQDYVDQGFIVLSLSSNDNGTVWPVWDAMRQPGENGPNADLTFFDDALGCLAAHYPVDEKRVYVAGHSAGGIMTNYVLQRRSELLAGGIVASGIFSLTSPEEKADLSPMVTLVTWGGEDDAYSGESNGVKVPTVNFVEQASLASQFYDKQPGVRQVQCTADVGHDWLPLNAFYIESLLRAPKGYAAKAALDPVAAKAVDAAATCAFEPFVLESGGPALCEQEPGGCEGVCAFMADCVVANDTVGPVLAPQTEAIGFGPMPSSCGGCVEYCENIVEADEDDADEEVLDCFADAYEAALSGDDGATQCGPGVEGAFPLINSVNTCCDGRDDSPYCLDLCGVLVTNSTAVGFLTACSALVGE